jgi:hypothetical protein
MGSVENEVLADLIEAVRTIAQQTLSLHLQLGAVRTLLARNGTISNAELHSLLTDLNTMTALDEIAEADVVPPPDEVFDRLLSRLHGTSQ